MNRLQPDITAAPPDTRRIVGLDIARAFAIVGMVIVNFKVVMDAAEGEPAWLRQLTSFLDGRAAATFVVLAGIGASLGSRRARVSAEPSQRRAARITLGKRALFLFVLGWLIFPVWPADILHYYGVYLAIGAVVLFVSDRTLMWLAAAAVASGLVFVVSADPFANWDLDDYSYQGLDTPAGFTRNLLFDGFHPIFPWVAFYLFGMWLGRTDLRDAARRRTLAWRAAIVVALCEGIAWLVVGARGSGVDSLDDDSVRWLLTVEPIPPTPLYVGAGAATAVLVILGSIWLGQHLAERIAAPLISTGQLALTIYLAHVFIGMGVLEACGRLEDQSLPWAVGTALAFSAVAVVASWAWRRRFRRGPVEALMRRVAG